MDALRKLTGLYRAEIITHNTAVNEESRLELTHPEILPELEQQYTAQKALLNEIASQGDTFFTALPVSKSDFEMSEIQKQIINLCRQGENAYRILGIMNQDNLEILKQFQGLLDAKMLVSETQQTAAKGFPGKEFLVRRWLRGIASLFTKDKREKEAEVPLTLVVQEIEMPQETEPLYSPAYNGNKIDLDEESSRRIKQYMAGRS